MVCGSNSAEDHDAITPAVFARSGVFIELIDKKIAELADWRGETLNRMRKLIHDADADVVEEVKWRKPSNSMLGVPVWSHDGVICTGETYEDKVKLTFAKGRIAFDCPSPARLWIAFFTRQDD